LDRNIRDVFLGGYMSSKDQEEVATQAQPGIDLMLAIHKQGNESSAPLLPAYAIRDMKDKEINFQGNYYPLSTMDTWEGTLWSDFRDVKARQSDFLNNSPHALGFSSEPGAGFYHNEACDTMIWVNGTTKNPEEVAPHLRVVAVEHGPDIIPIARRISAAAMLLDSEIDFEYDDRLGFITASPTNLGTALNIEIQLHSPYVLEENHLEVEDKYHVRFTQQEPTEEDLTPTIYVTNTTNLGMSEVQFFQNMH
jgi:hypothetical protein